MAAKENEALNGYCLYYFNQTDPHLLDDSTEDTLQQIFLIVAILFLWLIIAVSVPAALYSVIPIKTGKKPTTEQSSSTAEQGSTNEQNSANEQGSTTKKTTNNWENESTKLIRTTKKALAKTRESSDTYSIIAVFIIAPILDIILIALNVWLLVNCKFTWFILCFDTAFIALSAFEVVWISALAWHNRGELDKWCVLYAAGIFSLVVALQLLTFHGTFILLVFIFSPIPTACFTLIYISVLFSILSAVSIMIKVIHRYCEKKVRDKKCHYAFQITAAILLVFCVLSFDALFFITLMRARLDYFGISGFFGALVPTAIIALVSFIGNKMIEENKESSTGENDEEKGVVGNHEVGGYRPYGTCQPEHPNTGHFQYVQSSKKKSNTGEIDEEERVIENPGYRPHDTAKPEHPVTN